MALNNLELPAKVFLIGTTNDGKLSFRSGMWDADSSFTCVWASKSDLDIWLRRQAGDVPHI